MGPVLLNTISSDPFPIRTTNSTKTSSYSARTTTLTEPTGTGTTNSEATSSAIYDLTDASGGSAENSVLLQPFGATGSDSTSFTMKVLGWSVIKPTRGMTGRPQWIYRTLLELTCTIHTTGTTGVANVTGGIITAANSYFADTLAILGTSANDDVSVDIVSPADFSPAHCVLAMKGSRKLEFLFINVDTTSANCLVQPL